MKLAQWLLIGLVAANVAVASGSDDFSLGLHGSVNFGFSNSSDYVSQTFKNNGLETGTKTGVMFGVRGEKAISRYFYLQPEINYSQKGFGLSYGTAYKGSSSIDYLSAVLLAKVKLNPDGAVRPYFYAGPEFGVNIGEETILSASGTGGGNRDNSGRVRVALPYNDFDLAADIGAGVEASVGSGVSIFSDLRYSHGFFNIIKNPVAGASITTSTLQAIVGVKMAI